MSDYYKDTLALEFISDVVDIMQDGDNLAPEKLISDVVDMLKNYLAAQQGVQRIGGTCPPHDVSEDGNWCLRCGMLLKPANH